MHTRIVGVTIAVLMLCLGSFCQNNDKKDIVAKIDSFSITKDAYNAFSEMRRMYPSWSGDFFPGERTVSAYLIDMKVINSDGKAKSLAEKMKTKLDWEWKQRYFPAQLYLMKVLDANMGFTQKQLEDYYKSHTAEFKTKVTKPAPAPEAAAKDSTKKTVKAVAAPKDTIIQQTLPEVKDLIARKLFLAKYPVPDSLFKKANAKDTVKIDTAAIRDRWIYMVRSDLPNFFLKKSYEQKYKKALPDSLSDLCGKGKPVTPEDMAVIMSWLPESQRGLYNNPNGQRDLAKWLLKWKLFTEDAKKCGFSDQPEIKAIVESAWEAEVAINFVNNYLVPIAVKDVRIDTAMCVYAMWDERNSAATKDTAGINRTVSSFVKKQTYNKVDSMIYSIRKKHSVSFVAAEFKDEQDGNPAVMAVHADSLRDTGNTAEASGIYRQLETYFPFTSEGVRSFTELAKIQTEKGEYMEAVNNYRNFLVLGNDKTKMCNTFFMIGFIYDEYLNKPELAEVNYKWVLKNGTGCELSDDAEFMTLHLGEPMNSVEELRAEAKRQGRKVDTTNVDMPMDSGASKIKAKVKK